MSNFDDYINRAWESSRRTDLLNIIAGLTNDNDRVVSIFVLPEFSKYEIRECFAKKCNETSTTYRMQAEKLIHEGINDIRVLKLCSQAVKYACSESEELMYAYELRCRVLKQQGRYDLALKDVTMTEFLQQGIEKSLEILLIKADCSYRLGNENECRVVLTNAIEMLKKSDFENEIKAKYASEIANSFKKLNQSSDIDNNKSSQKENKIKVDFGIHNSLRSASAALDVRWSPEKGRHLVANRDIKIGSVLIVEEPYAWALNKQGAENHCLHCCCVSVAPVPCLHCSEVVFCGPECREKAWNLYHSYECKILGHFFNSREMSKMSLLVYRTVIATAVMSHHHSKQINRIEPDSLLKTENSEFGSNWSFLLGIDDIGKQNKKNQYPKVIPPSYIPVYEQVTNSSNRNDCDLLKRILTAIFLYKCMKVSLPEMEENVNLINVLFRHLQSSSCNAYEITELKITNNDIQNSEGWEMGGAVYPTVSLSNHSCNPNVTRHSHGKTCVVRTVRAIKKGNEILDNYGPHYLSEICSERQSHLKIQYFFRCQCQACSDNWPLSKDIASEIQFKCRLCFANIGSNLGVNNCPKCKKKIDNSKVSKQLRGIGKDYMKAVQCLLKWNIDETLKICIHYCNVLDPIVVHPCKEFVRFQQILILVWNILGNKDLIP